MNNKAVLIGATGLTGRHCLDLLLHDDDYSAVEILVRQATGLTHAKLTERIVDFGKIGKIDLADAHHVFCCLGTTIKKAGSQARFFEIDHDYVVACAKVAEKAMAEKFLYISSIGANPKSGNFYLRTKGQVEESLRYLIIPTILIFRPSMLLGQRSERRTAEWIGRQLMPLFGFMLIGRLRKYRAIAAWQVAKAMINEAKTGRHSGFTIIESDRIGEY